MTSFWKIFQLSLIVLSSANRSKYFYLTKTLPPPIQRKDNLAECLFFQVTSENLISTLTFRIRIEAESVYFKRQFLATVEKITAFDMEHVTEMGTGIANSYIIHVQLFLVDLLKSLKLLIKRERQNDFSALDEYYIIMLPVNVPNVERILKQIIKFCWKNYILNLNILFEDADGVVTMFTYFPFTEKSCKNITPVIRNRFINGSLEYSLPFFPSKTNNFWQCPLKAIMWHDPPFVILDQDKLSGFHGTVLLNLAAVMNFSVEVVVSPGQIGEVFPNGSTTGGFKMIEDGLGDLMVGNIAFNWLRRQFFATSKAYHRVPINLVFKGPRAYNPLEILLFPFDKYTWLTVFLVFTGKWIGSLLWKRVESGSILRRECCTRLRVMPWVFGIFILRSSYEGSVFKFIHNMSFRPIPKNINEAVEQGYTFFVQQVDIHFLESVPELEGRMIGLNSSLQEALNFLYEIDGNYALIHFGEELPYSTNDSDKFRDYYICPKPFLILYACIYLSKFSYLTAELNNKLQYLNIHGHILKNLRTFSSKESSRRNKLISGDIKSMTLQQLEGSFQLFFVLIVVSVFVFVVEKLLRYNRPTGRY